MADGGFALPTRLRRRKKVADLFCGASGMGSGAKRAAKDLDMELDLVGVNHWPIAIETSRINHPDARFLCADLEHTKPLDAVPGGFLDLLLAAPSCVFHSRARGGRTVHDQQRMDPWHVVRWCTELRVVRILVENVPEFMKWGPCDIRTGRPIKSREGEYFHAWLNALRAIGFKVDYRVQNCANFGDATTRERFLLIGRSDGKRLRWPEPSHAQIGGSDLLSTRQPWRPASEIIDWSVLGTSLFTRKKQLVDKTISRLLSGARREHWPRQHIEAMQALLDRAVPRLDVTEDEACEIAERLGGALVMATASGGAARGDHLPIPTAVGGGNGARPHFAHPLLMGVSSTAQAYSTESPCPTLTTGGASATKRPGNARPRLALPIIAPYYGGGSGLSAQGAHAPIPAITTKARFGFATPFIITITHTGQRQHTQIGGPIKTVTGANRGEFALAQPALIGYQIDVLYRMLLWRELARATSFDDEGEVYNFAGNATEITKQIGNAVPNRTAKAHVRALLEV